MFACREERLGASTMGAFVASTFGEALEETDKGSPPQTHRMRAWKKNWTGDITFGRASKKMNVEINKPKQTL